MGQKKMGIWTQISRVFEGVLARNLYQWSRAEIWLKHFENYDNDTVHQALHARQGASDSIQTTWQGPGQTAKKRGGTKRASNDDQASRVYNP
jgi:hypothetical protein